MSARPTHKGTARRNSTQQDSLPPNHGSDRAKNERNDSATPRNVPPPSVESRSSRVASAFVNIPFNDFTACIRFINSNPNVLQSDRKPMLDEARLAFSNNNADLGNRLLQRLLILRHCDASEITDDIRKCCSYVAKLQNPGDPEYEEDMKKLRRALEPSSSVGMELQSQSLQSVDSRASNLSNQISALPQFPQASTRYPAPYPPITGASHMYAPPAMDTGSATSRLDYSAYDLSPRESLTVRPSNMHHPQQPLSQSAPVMSSMDSYMIQRRELISSRRQCNDNAISPLGAMLPNVPSDSSQHTMMPPTRAFHAMRITPGVLHGFVPGASNPHNQTTAEIPTNNPMQVASNPNNPMEAVDELPEQTNLIWRRGVPTRADDNDLDIQASDFETETEGYKMQDSPFFKAGRVFAILWPAPAGHNRKGQRNAAKGLSMGAKGNMVHSKKMFMLIVSSKRGYCICCPIRTYDGRGLGKFVNAGKKFRQQEARAHAIIYSDTQRPARFPDEPEMGKDALPVKMARGRELLDIASRVHFGQFFTVEHNVPVQDIGSLNSRDTENIKYYFREIHHPSR